MPIRPVRGLAPLEVARLSPYPTDPAEGCQSGTQAKPAGTGATAASPLVRTGLLRARRGLAVTG
jgi:hypothetical protein